MSFNTRFEGQIILAPNPADMVFGTVMLGDLFGEVTSASIVRAADLEEVKAAGSVFAAIMSNPKFEFEFETTFRNSVNPPGLGDLLQFPFAGIKGRVLPPITIKWSENGHRGLSIKATSWDNFQAVNQGGGNAYTFDGTLYTPLV